MQLKIGLWSCLEDQSWCSPQHKSNLKSQGSSIFLFLSQVQIWPENIENCLAGFVCILKKGYMCIISWHDLSLHFSYFLMCVGERIKEGVQWCETHEMAWGWYDCIAHERQSVNQVCSSFLELNILHFKEKAFKYL